MTKKVLYYAPQKNDTTSWWRMCGVMPYISIDGVELRDVSNVTHFSWDIFSGSDIFIMQRPFTPEHISLIHMAKDCGCKIITDYDDNLLAVPMYNPTHGLYEAHRSSVMRCIDLSDEIWVSTKAIADAYGKKCVVIPNALNDYLFPLNNAKQYKPGGKKAMYRGGASHQADVYAMADDLIMMITLYPEWTFISVGEIYTYIAQRCGDNYQLVGGMNIMQFFRYLNTENPNAVYFPLETNDFNKAKSNICWIEATYAGAAFFGNIELPEYPKDCVMDIEMMPNLIGYDSMMQKHQERSFRYICDNLCLSKINRIRAKQILANL